MSKKTTLVLEQLVNDNCMKVLRILQKFPDWVNTECVRSELKDTRHTAYARLKALFKCGLVQHRKPRTNQRNPLSEWRLRKVTREFLSTIPEGTNLESAEVHSNFRIS